MLKTHYFKELQLSKDCSRGSRGPEVKRIQEWLCLWSMRVPMLPKIKIDGDFGPASQAAVIAFQKWAGIAQAAVPGVVDRKLFAKLCSPIVNTFDHKPNTNSIREAILSYGKQHLLQGARELGLNEGPWVRSYMNGLEGQSWPWCVGFLQTIFDQALSFSGKEYTDYLPATFSCDVLGQYALKQKTLIRNADLRKNASLVKPGDIFLIARTPSDWTHAGIIEEVTGKTFFTLEGNTNEAGSREGIAVMRRIRNFHTNPIDVIRFPHLD